MPLETDQARLDLLWRLLETGGVLVKPRAFTGHKGEPDDLGLDRVLPARFSDVEKVRLIRRALADFIRTGGAPNRVEYMYEDKDPETIYEFRFEFTRTRLMVKTELKADRLGDPVLEIKSVKRQN